MKQLFNRCRPFNKFGSFKFNFRDIVIWVTHIFIFFSFCKDDNRYNAGRGAHKNLKRAEKARTLVSKIPCELRNSPFYTSSALQ